MLQRGILISLICLLIPMAAMAQKVELTPFVGFHFGGEFDDDTDVFPSSFSQYELDDSESVGVILGIAAFRGLQVEFIWSRQETELIEEPFFGGGIERSDIELSYYHVGVAYEWKLGQVRPFAAVSVGVTELDPVRSDFAGDTRASAGLGGGVKLMFTKNLGLRFEGRLLVTDTSDNDYDCDDFDCYCDGYDCGDDNLTQGVFRGGLVITF